MKAKFVKDTLLEFEKGLDPKTSLNIGQAAKIRDWFENNWGKNSWDRVPEYQINKDLSIDIKENFSLPWSVESIPEFIKFGTIHGDMDVTRKKEINNLDWFPKKITGDLEFYANGIRPKKEELLDICDIDGDIELESHEQKSARMARQRMKERGPLKSRTEHDLRKYPTKPHKYGPIYSKGYKTYQALKAVEASGDTGLRYTDIIRILYELNYGSGNWDPVENRGWGASYFSSYDPGSLYGRVKKNDKRRYVITDKGREYLKKYADIFDK